MGSKSLENTVFGLAACQNIGIERKNIVIHISHASVGKKTVEWLGAVSWPLSQIEHILTARFLLLDSTPKNEGYHFKNNINDHFWTLILMWYGLLVWFGLV